jgi:hypothetical protein
LVLLSPQVVEGFLSKQVSHFITPVKLDKDKENDTQQKTLSIPHPLGTLRSPFDLKTCVMDLYITQPSLILRLLAVIIQ